MEKPKKILAILFKYLGDVVIAVPSLRALKERFPDCEIHMAVAEEAAPLLHGLPYLTKVWAFPRARDNAQIRKSWPVIRALRREKFDRSVDFVGNDRGALVSLLVGARVRLAPIADRGFMGRHLCYNQRIKEAHNLQHEIFRDLHIISHWDVPHPSRLNLEIHTNPVWDDYSADVIPQGSIIAHISTSQQRKEWPVSNWARLNELSREAGYELYFSAGPSAREQQLMKDLLRLSPGVKVLPTMQNLGTYLAVLKRARMFITGDTGPLHFAIGLGVPTISLWGASSVRQWAPIWPEHEVLHGKPCTCPSTSSVCTGELHCVAQIKPERVLRSLKEKTTWQPAAQ